MIRKFFSSALTHNERLWRRSRRLCSWLVLSGSSLWFRTWWLFDNVHSNKLSSLSAQSSAGVGSSFSRCCLPNIRSSAKLRENLDL